MEIIVPILMKCPLFKNINEKDINDLLSCLQYSVKKYQNDELVFTAGDIINSIGIVLEGSLEIIKENLVGNTHIVAFLRPGDMFGEGIVCTSNRISPVTVRVKEFSKVMLIPYERILNSCSETCGFHHQLIYNMMILLGEKNWNLNFKLEILMLKGMREKLATYLLSEWKRQGNTTLQILPNRTELAEYLNVSRTSMCRELSRMKSENILDYYQNNFRIISPEKLANCLEI